MSEVQDVPENAATAADPRRKSPKLDQLLRFMVKQNASDLHIKPMRPPLLRVGGRLLPIKAQPLAPEAVRQMLEATLNESQLADLERDQAVDFGYSVEGLSRFRGSIFTQRGTLGAVFRRVPFDFRTLDEWGLPPVLADFIDLPQGLILITGPTGSGKSSTLAALMRMIAETRHVHIVTVEDPIEYLLSDAKASVTQREVGMDTPSFATALRNALRQDPDVIMVGEMRDADTMQTVLTAAETGHLVFSTLHTNSAAQTIDRIIDTFPSGNHNQIRQQLAAVLQGVISLKLVERKDGKGLVGAVEILRKTPPIEKLIAEGSLQALQEEVEGSVAYHRMQSMNQSLAALVLNNQIAYKTALSVSINPGDLDLMLRKLLFASGGEPGSEGDEMAESMSDFSKIVELQEIKRLYDEMQERHTQELADKDEEIERLRHESASQMPSAPDPGAVGELDRLRDENDRLNKQVQLVRHEMAAKVERLNARIRELSGQGGGSQQQQQQQAQPGGDAERRGFFRR